MTLAVVSKQIQHTTTSLFNDISDGSQLNSVNVNIDFGSGRCSEPVSDDTALLPHVLLFHSAEGAELQSPDF